MARARLSCLGAAACAIVLLAGCAGSGATEAPPSAQATMGPPAVIVTAIVTAGPTPSPTAPVGFVNQVAAACNGIAVPGAAPLGGSVHPVYIVIGGYVQRADKPLYSFSSADDQEAWLKAEWSEPLQLVACPSALGREEVGSCGSYANAFGQTFEVTRYRLTRAVKIVEAATGQTIRTETLSGSDPEPCAQQESSESVFGKEPDVNKFVLTLTGL